MAIGDEGRRERPSPTDGLEELPRETTLLVGHLVRRGDAKLMLMAHIARVVEPAAGRLAHEDEAGSQPDDANLRVLALETIEPPLHLRLVARVEARQHAVRRPVLADAPVLRNLMECRSLADTVPVLTDLLAFERVTQELGAVTLRHPNTRWKLVIHEAGPDAPPKQRQYRG